MVFSQGCTISHLRTVQALENQLEFAQDLCTLENWARPPFLFADEKLQGWAFRWNKIAIAGRACISIMYIVVFVRSQNVCIVSQLKISIIYSGNAKGNIRAGNHYLHSPVHSPCKFSTLPRARNALPAHTYKKIRSAVAKEVLNY